MHAAEGIFVSIREILFRTMHVYNEPCIFVLNGPYMAFYRTAMFKRRMNHCVILWLLWIVAKIVGEISVEYTLRNRYIHGWVGLYLVVVILFKLSINSCNFPTFPRGALLTYRQSHACSVPVKLPSMIGVKSIKNGNAAQTMCIT